MAVSRRARRLWIALVAVLGAAYFGVSVYNQFNPPEPAYLQQAREAAARRAEALGEVAAEKVDETLLGRWRAEAALAIELKTGEAEARLRNLAAHGDAWARERLDALTGE